MYFLNHRYNTPLNVFICSTNNVSLFPSRRSRSPKRRRYVCSTKKCTYLKTKMLVVHSDLILNVFCCVYAARRPGETAIAARAPAVIAAGPETGATAPNPQVKKEKPARSLPDHHSKCFVIMKSKSKCVSIQ